MLAIGLTDMGPARLPERFEQALAVVSAYLERRGSERERATYERLLLVRPQVEEWSGRLASLPGAVTLDHNDLHAWNVFYAVRGGPVDVRFYDWGDAVVAHPFSSMLIGLGWLKRMWGVGDDDPRLLRARDAYLEPYGGLGSRALLVETLELSCRLGEIARALVWARALGQYGEQAPDSFQSAPVEHLSGLLDRSYLGDRTGCASPGLAWAGLGLAPAAGQPQPRSCSRCSPMPKWWAISCTTVTATSATTSSRLAHIRRVGPRNTVIRSGSEPAAHQEPRSVRGVPS